MCIIYAKNLKLLDQFSWKRDKYIYYKYYGINDIFNQIKQKKGYNKLKKKIDNIFLS